MNAAAQGGDLIYTAQNAQTLGVFSQVRKYIISSKLFLVSPQFRGKAFCTTRILDRTRCLSSDSHPLYRAALGFQLGTF